ncbi:hypothetical protein Btru_022623 [Bulinus truncatus]|nr:hypothetical protein Btru_022623 [Bulinus truncatus]
MRRKLEQTEEELHSLNNDLQELDSSTVQEKVNKDQTSDKQDLGNNDNDSKYHLKTVVDDVAKAASLPPTEPFIAPHSVGLKGYCTQSMQCEDPNAACIDHNCYCKNGYYIKDGLCRKVCPALSFECFELGTLSRGPECISRENVCDSYMHCADGSDEFNCDSIVASPQISDLNRLSSGGTNTRQGQGQSEALLKSAAQTSLKNSKPSQQLSQDSTRQDLQKNFESKDDSSQKDRELQAGQVSLLNNDAKSAVKHAQLSSDGLAGSKHEAAIIDRPHSDKTNTDSKLVDNNNLPTNPGSNLANLKSTNYKNNVFKETHDSFSEPFPQEIVNESPSRNRVNESRSLDSVGDHNKILPSVQDSQPMRPKIDTLKNQYLSSPAEDSVQATEEHTVQEQNIPNSEHGQSNSLHSERLRPLEEDSRADETESRIFKHIGSNSPKKTPVLASHASKPQHMDSPEYDMSAGKSKSSLLSPDKSYPSHKASKSHVSSDNSHKWLDSGLYVPYSLSDTPDQRHQPQHSSSGQYLDTSQYYPPYSSDTLDGLPNSLLSNLGSSDDFTQYGGSYLDRDKSLANAYQTGNQNARYLGLPDTGYGSQYPGSNRYDYSGEYRSPTYHDPDFYPAVNNQHQYRPVSGLYEDFPSGPRLLKPSGVNRPEVKSVQISQHESSSESQDHKSIGEVQENKPSVSSTLPLKFVTTTLSTTSTTSRSELKAQPVATTIKPSHPHSNEHVFVSSEKVIIASASSNAEGPIIALSLGLALTIILLVLVGCRLRNMRHRKLFFSNFNLFRKNWQNSLSDKIKLQILFSKLHKQFRFVLNNNFN